MFKKKFTKQLLAIALTMLIAVVGISAIFIDFEAKEAGFTVIMGDIEIELTGVDDLYAATHIMPLEEYALTRAVHNTGSNSAYVYATVTIPVDTVYLTTYDGSQMTAKLTQLFSYGTADGTAGVNEDWTLVTSGTYGRKSIQSLGTKLRNASEAYGVLDTNAKTVTYVYAYTGSDDEVLNSLTADRTTSNLFDVVKVADLDCMIREYDISETVGLVVVRAYAIQLSGVTESADKLGTVWSIFGAGIEN